MHEKIKITFLKKRDRASHISCFVLFQNIEIQNQFGTCLANWDEIYELVMNSSVIVGLHPDQAAGSIIDLALLLNKPFVVISCPIDTYSGYGSRARDIVRTLVNSEKYDMP